MSPSVQSLVSHLSDASSLQLLRNRVEAAKLELSALAYTVIALPLGGETVTVPMSRAHLEALCEDLFERLLEPVLFQIFWQLFESFYKLSA